MNKVIVSAAITGGTTPKDATPYLPLTPDEIANDVVKVARAGAAVVHLHSRDEDGKPSSDIPRWVKTIEGIRQKLKEENLDVVLNPTSSCHGATYDERLAPLPILKCEMTSLDAGSFNMGHKRIFFNHPEFLERLCTLCLENEIKPEIEIFDSNMMHNVEHLLSKGLIKEPPHYQFVLGAGGGMDGSLENLDFLVRMLPKGATWSATGIGIWHLPVIYGALALNADGIRGGLEDNIYFGRGIKGTNEQMIERAVKIAKLANREIATAEDARKILGLVKKV